MFWRTQPEETLSIADLLNKENVTLREILEDPYALQEVKCNNQKLIDFLKTDSILLELTHLCLTEPQAGSSTTDTNAYKYAHLASEILSADAEQITLALSHNVQCFACLSQFLATDRELNPLLASFFAKIISLLVQRFPCECLALIQKDAHFLDNCYKHLRTYAIVDALFRFCACVDNEEGAVKIRAWLCEHKFLLSLLETFDDFESCDNAAYLIVELIRYLRDSFLNSDKTDVDPMLQQIQSSEFIDNLLLKMIPLSSRNQRAFSNGCIILLTMLQTVPGSFSLAEFNASKLYEENVVTCQRPSSSSENGAKIIQENDHLLKSLISQLSNFMQILSRDQIWIEKNVLLPMGPTKSLGCEKLYTLKLIAQCITVSSSVSSYSLHEKLSSMNFLAVIFDNFLAFPYNNFFHCCVCHIVYFIFNVKLVDGTTEIVSPLLKTALEKSFIVKVTLDGLASIKNQGLKRSPYRGYLLKLAEIIKNAMNNSTNSEYVRIQLNDNPVILQQWMNFESTELNPYLKMNEPDPVGPRPVSDISMMQDEATVPASGLSSNLISTTAQSVSDSQDITERFVPAKDFLMEGNDNFIKASSSTSENFAEDTASNQDEEMSSFENLCKERVSAMDQTADDDDMWFEREMVFSKERTANNKELSDENNSSPENMFCNDDNNTAAIGLPSDSFNEINQKKMEVEFDPWADIGQNKPADDNWANFNAANFDASNAKKMKPNLDRSTTTTTTTVSSPPVTAEDPSDWADFDSFRAQQPLPQKNATRNLSDEENWADFTKNYESSQDDDGKSATMTSSDSLGLKSVTNVFAQEQTKSPKK